MIRCRAGLRIVLGAAAALYLAFAAAFAGPAAAQNRPAPPSAELLARQFERIAFSSEYGGAHRAGRLIRWREPIVVAILGDDTGAFRAEVEGQLAELRALTRHPIDFQRGEAPASLVIEFSTSRGATTFEPGAPCRTVMWDRDFAIYRARIYITPAPDELRRHCIAEEITQALGLADDSPLIRDSIFHDWNRRQRIAPWDALMVRMLYDPRIAPGMDRAQAMPLVRQIILEDAAARRSASTTRRLR